MKLQRILPSAFRSSFYYCFLLLLLPKLVVFSSPFVCSCTKLDNLLKVQHIINCRVILLITSLDVSIISILLALPRLKVNTWQVKLLRDRVIIASTCIQLQLFNYRFVYQNISQKISLSHINNIYVYLIGFIYALLPCKQGKQTCVHFP